MYAPWTIYQNYYYRTKKTFTKWSLYVSFIIHFILMPLIFFTGSGVVAINFQFALQTGSTVFWAFFAISIILLIIMFIFISRCINYTSSSLIFTNTPMQSFDGVMTSRYIILNATFKVMESILSLFPEWTNIVLILLHMACMLTIVRRVFYFPNLTIEKNVITA